MKKFKTSAEKKELNNHSLKAMLAEKNFVLNALVRFSHVPLGLVVSLCLGLSILLIQSPSDWSAWLLMPYLAVGGTALLYMWRSWLAFQAHRSQLQHVRNGFLGQKRYPVLFGLLQLFLAAALGLPALLLTLLSWGVLVLFLKNQQTVWYALYFTLLGLYPLSVNFAPQDLPAVAPALLLGLVLYVLSQKQTGFLFLNQAK